MSESTLTYKSTTDVVASSHHDNNTSLELKSSTTIAIDMTPAASASEADISDHDQYQAVPSIINEVCTNIDQVAHRSLYQAVEQWTRQYIGKFAGIPDTKKPPKKNVLESLLSAFISFAVILVIAVVDYCYLRIAFPSAGNNDLPVVMLTGAYGATAVLVCDLYSSPFSQPRNVIGSYTISAFLGVCVRLFGEHLAIPIWVQSPLAVAIAVFFMNIFEVVHPPGGAAALMAIIGTDSIYSMQVLYRSSGQAHQPLCS